MKSKQPSTSGRRPPSRTRSRALPAAGQRAMPEAQKPVEMTAGPQSAAPASAFSDQPFEMPKVETSGEVRDSVERSYTSFTRGTADVRAKVIEAMSASASNAFACAQELAAAKSLPEAAAVYGSHACKQLETCSVQARELSELVQKIAADAMAPLTSGFPQMFRTTPVSS
jgi:hypothetical protein